MEKKVKAAAKAKNAATSAKAKKGERLVCDLCGATVVVDKECGCDACGITCCGQDMTVIGCC
jgi:hypothetical protein